MGAARELRQRRDERAASTSGPAPPAAGGPMQIPQDAGSRASRRDRDALLASFPADRFPDARADARAQGRTGLQAGDVSRARRLRPAWSRAQTGSPTMRQVHAAAEDVCGSRSDSRQAHRASGLPIELYDDLAEEIELLPRRAARGRRRLVPSWRDRGTIEIRSLDPLGDRRDPRRGRAGASSDASGTRFEAHPASIASVTLVPNETGDENSWCSGRAASASRARRRRRRRTTSSVWRRRSGADPRRDTSFPSGRQAGCWAQASTILAAGVGAALTRRRDFDGDSAWRLRRRCSARTSTGWPSTPLPAMAIRRRSIGMRVRVWRAGDPIPEETAALRRSVRGRLPPSALLSSPSNRPSRTGSSFEREGEGELRPSSRFRSCPVGLRALVAQVDPDRMRMYQFHPLAGRAASSRRTAAASRSSTWNASPRRPARRGDGSSPGSSRPAASEDPFAGCLAGYVLLRLGLHPELETLAAAIAGVAPRLSDAHILRGELEAFRKRPEAAAQAFADAVNVGVPAFGEGLTRLLEGLRAELVRSPARGPCPAHLPAPCPRVDVGGVHAAPRARAGPACDHRRRPRL